MIPKDQSNTARRRTRLDQALVERGLCDSRERAQRLILAGSVRINGQLAAKASNPVRPTDEVAVAAPERFVSRGGFKLDHALEAMRIPVSGLVAADFGASTGGFTDCLLQRGAAKVIAIDVGQGQLAWKLRQDPRVVVLEKTNARQMCPEKMPQPFQPVDMVVIDCSFISLRQLLPAAGKILRKGGSVVALIKPQFEAGKEEADRGAGVITDPAVHERVIAELREFVAGQTDLRWLEQVESPLLGPAGNKEFLVRLEKTL
jgi:23S rRNA (cytidine1920-2'-O)/16S rRNA (cytidine1409-2'-O)-methyltransferase